MPEVDLVPDRFHDRGIAVDVKSHNKMQVFKYLLFRLRAAKLLDQLLGRTRQESRKKYIRLEKVVHQAPLLGAAAEVEQSSSVSS